MAIKPVSRRIDGFWSLRGFVGDSHDFSREEKGRRRALGRGLGKKTSLALVSAIRFARKRTGLSFAGALLSSSCWCWSAARVIRTPLRQERIRSPSQPRQEV
jgi:hypothetical protein